MRPDNPLKKIFYPESSFYLIKNYLNKYRIFLSATLTALRQTMLLFRPPIHFRCIYDVWHDRFLTTYRNFD